MLSTLLFSFRTLGVWGVGVRDLGFKVWGSGFRVHCTVKSVDGRLGLESKKYLFADFGVNKE